MSCDAPTPADTHTLSCLTALSATFSHTHSHTVHAHTIRETADQTLPPPIPSHHTHTNHPNRCEQKGSIPERRGGGISKRRRARGRKEKGSGGSVWERQMGQRAGQNNDEREEGRVGAGWG